MFNSFSIKFVMAFMYPSRWYQEGITVCCMLTRYSSSLVNHQKILICDKSLKFHIVTLYVLCTHRNILSKRRRLEPLVDIENCG